jgi:HAD superfamily hydrolase (TIGR01509 family)
MSDSLLGERIVTKIHNYNNKFWPGTMIASTIDGVTDVSKTISCFNSAGWRQRREGMIRAILFDSDGVLVDTERMFFEATQAAFSALGVCLSRNQWAKWYLGEGRRSREIAALFGLSLASVERAIQNRNEMFWRRVASGVPILPGVRDILPCLSRRFRLAIVTGASRPHFDRVHAHTGLPWYFELVVTSDDYEEPKPSPQAYLTALNKLSLKPFECLAVEDSPRGAAAATSAGIRCVLVPTLLTEIALCPGDCEILAELKNLSNLIPEGV